MAKRTSNVEDIFGLSPMQEGILFHTIHAPHSGLYVEQFACTLTGPLDVSHFEAAWSQVVSRHAILRTLFTWEKRDRPLQVVRKSVTLPWRHEDWRGEGDHDARVRAFLRLDRQAGIALDRAPLLRFALFRTADDQHRFVWTFHHLLLDGWSMRLVLREALDTYERLRDGRTLTAGRARPYRDFVTWLDARNAEDAEPYWRAALRGFETPTPLVAARPGNHPRWAEQHDTLELSLSPEATQTLVAAARSHRLTLNTFLRGAWALYLARTSGEADVVFGATVSGRSPDLEGVDEMVGLFINSIPVRVRVPEDERVATWLESLQRDQLDSSTHDSAPLADIQRWSDVHGAPLFQSLLVVENHPADPAGPAPALAMSDADYVEQSNFPLALLAVPGDSLDVIFVYDRDRFDRDAMEGMAARYEAALVAIAERPEGRVGDVSLLSAEDARRVLVEFNDTHRDIDADTCIHHLIRGQADRKADAVAVRFEGASLTYGELMSRADALAGHLESMGIGPGRSVAIGVDRSLEMIVAILGVLEAGAAYVPFTPDQPIERTRHLLDDTDAAAVLSAGVHLETLQSALAAGPGSAPVLAIDEAYPAAGRRTSPAGPGNVAYTIYTSGSTGTPKGVDVSHRALVHSTRARSVTYPEDVSAFCLLSPFVFDSSVAGIFWTLTTGGTLLLPSPRMEQDIPALAPLLRAERVSHYLALPVVHGLILEHADAADLTALRTVVLAGEACPAEVVRAHSTRLPDVSLYNEYGPTEATVWSTVHRITGSDADGAVPIGRPIANAQVYVLDPNLRPVPPGVPGELCIGGAGLAEGYRNRPDETAAKFVSIDLGGRDVRIYRTGDRARYRADGLIDFLGRIDHQIKIRGHRIELGEIEAHLRREPRVRDAVVVASEADGRASLIAYVEGPDELAENALRSELAAALPEYMVPSRITVLPSLPRTPTGKIDRGALPEPEPGAPSVSDEASPAPRNPGEERLAALWADVLGRDRVGIHDNFFELGGDSILSIRIIARAREAGFRISPQEFFDYPTVAGLAAVATPSVDAESVRAAVAEGPVPLTPVQHWFFETIDTDPHHWNQAARLDVPPGLELGHLTTAVDALVEHHDALRLRFRSSQNGWTQELHAPTEEALVTEVDVADAADIAVAIDAAEAALHATLSLENPPLVRAVLCLTPADRRDQLVLVIHHLAVDAVSWPILIEDLGTACRQIRSREPIRLPAPTVPFSVWAARQAERADSPEIREQRAYWLASTADRPPALPLDGEDATRNTWGNSATTSSSLKREETDTLLQEAATTYRMRVNEFLLCALALAFRQWTGSPRVLVDIEGHGRDHGFDDVDVTRTVGWFTTVYPIQLELPKGDAHESCLIAIKERVRAVPDSGVGYGLLRYLNSDESVRAALASVPAAEVSFNYLGRRGDGPNAEGFSWVSGADASARSPRTPRPHLLEINAAVTAGTLSVDWTYCPSVHWAETVASLADAFMSHLRALIEHCTKSTGTATPSDFPLAGLDADELARLSGLLGDSGDSGSSS